ncbi:MAG: hypothetical protein FD180_3162 [Planctomycetota bacterium]|nr:MAG: hypothetical protein FD180_3162 [Planctomycetota bacterium]
MPSTLPWTLLFTLACAAAARAGEPFEIRLDRPLKKGAKFTIESHLERVSDNAMGGPAVKGVITIELKGVIEVTEVDAKGRVARASCKVEKCTTAIDGGAPVESLPAGHVIALETKAGKLEVALGKDGIDKRVAELLVRFAPWEGTDDALCDDAIFGTADKKKEGETWELDGNKIVPRLALSRKEKLDSAKAKGTAKVGSASDVGGVKCLDLEIEVTVPDIESRGHLAGFKLTDSALTWTIKKTVPQGAAPSVIVLKDTMDAHQTLKGNMGGGQMTVEFKENTTRTITLTAMK